MENNKNNKSSEVEAPSNGMRWLPWAEFIIGIWIIVSPWFLGYWRVTSALWSGVVAGVLVSLLALWQIAGTEDHHNENR